MFVVVLGVAVVKVVGPFQNEEAAISYGKTARVMENLAFKVMRLEPH